MQKLKRLILDWLGFSRTEINGFLILLPLLIVLIFSEPVYRLWLTYRTDDFTNDQRKLDSLVAFFDTKPENPDHDSESKHTRAFFAFDPNTSSVAELEMLGFSKILSNRIAHYRQKGGRFRVKSDLLKIYGLDSTFYHKLYAYIQLPAHQQEVEQEPKMDVQPSALTSNKRSVFDLNTADTTQLKKIYGIGTKLSARIVKFREGLGGFVNPAQLKEVYGLDSAAITRLTKEFFIDKNFTPRKINLNKADENELSSHPYISRSVAKAILAYRFQHGAFKDIADLGKLSMIGPGEVQRLIPYLKIND